MKNPRPIGVLLAAGRGRRMNGAKQFFPWETGDGVKPLVAAAFDAIADSCQQMLVVFGHRASEVQELLESRSFSVCIANPDAPMFESVQAGIAAALELDGGAPILLHPADHPEVDSRTLQRLQQAAETYPEKVIIADHQGRGGHPVWLPVAVAETLLHAACPQGLGQYWRDHPELSHRLEVADETITRDLDHLPTRPRSE